MALLTCILSPASLTAAPGPSSSPADSARNPLALKQQIVRDRMAQLEDRMYRLIEQLSAREPEQARRLETALKKARELLIRRNMDETIRLLDDQDLAGASDRQIEVIGDLENVLKLMLESPENSRQRQEEIARLEAYREQARKLLDTQRKLEVLAKAIRSQRDLAKRTEQLARDMTGQAPQSQPARPPAPGSDNVQRAAGEMGKAAEQIEQQKNNEADESQKKASDELEKAIDSLEQAIEQLRQEQRRQTLRDLRTRLQTMLEKQLKTNRDTQAIDKKGPEAWTHSDELAISGMANDEQDLADQASEVLRILKAEGETLVFSELLQQVRDDLEQVAMRLQKKDTAVGTQGLQAGIAATLAELVDSLKQMESNAQDSSSGGSGGNCDGKPALVPPIAELRLLRNCQQRLHQQTVAIQESIEKNMSLTADQRSEVQRLSERQNHLADLAKKMHEQLIKK